MMRHLVVALLMAVLTLAGVGRGLAAASDAEQTVQSIPGVVTPICHGGAADGSRPGDPVHHDCCDQCALGAPVIVAAGPVFRFMMPASHALVRSAVAAWTVRLSRARSPRQSQGPPTA